MCFPRRLFGLVALLITAQDLRAQDPFSDSTALNRDAVIGGLTSSLRQLTTEIQNPEFANYHNSLEDFARLKREVQRSVTNASLLGEVRIEYSRQFLATLDYDRQAFQVYADSAKRKIVTQSIFDSVINASIDLGLKAIFVGKNRKDQVETTVNTVDQKGQSVPKCYVWYAPFLKDDEQHKLKFDKLSTPTTDVVAAGKWNIWSEKAGKTGPKTEYSCGDDGRLSRAIDIPAPQ
jgi:hypothetical protein